MRVSALLLAASLSLPLLPPVSASAWAGDPPQRKVVPLSELRLGRGGDTLGYPTVLPDRLELLERLASRQFGWLASQLRSVQEAYEKDFHREDWVVAAFDAFTNTDRSLSPLLDAWVEQSPEAWQAYLARAVHLQERAWKARGHRFRNATAEAQFERMRDLYARAEADAERALALRPRLIPGHRLILREARAQGKQDAALRQLRVALEACPQSFWIRLEFMRGLLPRWGGSHEAMRAFARYSIEQVPENPRMRWLGGYVDWDEGRVAMQENRPEDALAHYDRALKHGPYWLFYHFRAAAHRKLKRYDEALADLDAALAQQPQRTDSLLRRADIHKRRRELDAARADLDLLLRLDAADTRAMKMQQKLEVAAMRNRLAQRGDAASAADAGSPPAAVAETRSNDPVARARARLRARDREGAVAVLEEAIADDPDDLTLLREVDRVLALGHDWERILEHWNRYLERRPEDAEALFERSGTYYHQGNLVQAFADLERACALGHRRACDVRERYGHAKP